MSVWAGGDADFDLGVLGGEFWEDELEEGAEWGDGISMATRLA